MRKLLIGNEAVARGAWEAGCSVVSSYPGTPSTEVTEFLAKYDDLYAEWAPNEKVACEVAIGAAVAGARSLCAMKHVGLNVAADPLYTASYTGVNGGMVMVVADDPGMHSSQNEQDTRYHAKTAKVPVLEPADSAECKAFTKLAYELSEEYDTPVILRLTTRVAHSQSIVELEDKCEYKLKDYEKNPLKYVMMPAMAKKRHVYVEERMERMTEYADTSDINVFERNEACKEGQHEGKQVCVICSGIVYQYAKEALGDNASYLKLGMLNPLPVNLFKQVAEEMDVIYVAEELDTYIETHVRSLGIEVNGKELFTKFGEYSAKMIADVVYGNESEAGAEESAVAVDVPNRPPVLCPGCPHRGIFYVLNKLKMQVTGDIGCYTLGALPPMSALDTCICMGASIGVAHGFEKARGKEFAGKTVAVLGDSTFVHSGITGLIDVVYNKGVSTVIILDNSITGMTGHQQNPSTGLTIRNEPTKQLDLIKLADAIGIERVTVVDPFDIKEFEKVVKAETSAEEPSLIIAQRPCALLKTVKHEGPWQIDSDKCKRCGNCMKLGCPAIVKKEEGYVINDSLCVGCGLCGKLCAFGAIGKAGE